MLLLTLSAAIYGMVTFGMSNFYLTELNKSLEKELDTTISQIKDMTNDETQKILERFAIEYEMCIRDRSGEELKLSAKEYDVLIYLAKNQGKILTKKQIYENVWNEEYVYDDDNIMAVISRLRKKIERTAENSYIQTVRGLGYRFNKEL